MIGEKSLKLCIFLKIMLISHLKINHSFDTLPYFYILVTCKNYKHFFIILNSNISFILILFLVWLELGTVFMEVMWLCRNFSLHSCVSSLLITEKNHSKATLPSSFVKSKFSFPSFISKDKVVVFFYTF